jgi:NO-binding membrane sensor protein with MHYT domain
MGTRKLLGISALAAVAAVVLALLYVSSDPEPLRLSTALATIFGVGVTVIVAGGLMALMYHSDRSGRDDIVGRNNRR